jgi:hypothetical protein
MVSTAASTHRPLDPSFTVEVKSAGTDNPAAANFLAGLFSLSRLTDQVSFNAFCKAACRGWKETFPSGLPGAAPTGERFNRLLQRISPSDPMTIPTPWGGVVVEKYEPPNPEVAKWLVVKEGDYLALEWHKEKRERMEVKEGVGMLLSGQSLSSPVLSIQVLKPTSVVEFMPGEVHCLIGCQNLLVWETSTDPKGMDKDLEFIFTPTS